MVNDKESNEKLFAAWLAQNAPSSQLSELYLCYPEIEAYCIKTKVLHKPLFETTDLETVHKVQKIISESRIFKFSRRKQMKRFVAAAQYYTSFVKILDTQKASDDTSLTAQSASTVSVEEKQDDVDREKAEISIESAEESRNPKIDFRHIVSLAHTEPISFAYFDEVQSRVSTWAQLYTQVLICLCEDYPDEFLRICNTNISGGRQIDFGTQRASEKMEMPEKVYDNFYVETRLSATDIVTKIRILLDRCNVDYENLAICYKQLNLTKQTKTPVSEMPAMKSNVPSAAATDAGNTNKESCQNCLTHDKNIAEQEAQDCASAVTNCEQPANQPGFSETTDYFDKFFEDSKYELLYRELKKADVATLEDLKEINLWSFMNLHRLYSIQQRLAISTELTARLRDTGKEDNEQDLAAYEIYYNDATYKGESLSAAFVAFLAAMSVKYPLKFRSLLDVVHPETGKVVVSRYYDETKLKMVHPEAYVDSQLSSERVEQYIAWVIERCGAVPEKYLIKEKCRGVKATVESLTKVAEQSAEIPVSKTAHAPDPYLKQEAETYLLQCDLKGAAYDELQRELRYTMVGTKEIVAQSSHIIEMNKRLYHEDALVDFEEGANALEAILEKLLKKNNGVATAKHLHEYARSEMTMFFNDNDITDQQSVYDLARHLFEKLNYHGKRYVFRSNTYISLPKVSADSIVDIVKKYAGEKGTTVTFKEVESYLTGLGLSTGNLRALMRIDKEPVFLIYAENEYLLAELMHIDAAFLESIRCALHRLLADTDGYIIPRNISGSWYNLLPALPASLEWTPMLLQQLIRFYPDELEARTIIAMESQSSNTLHAMFVQKESWMQDFRDVVAAFLHDEMPNRCEFEAEELRGMLANAGMISGNELIYNMHNALGGDPRFLWNSDGSHVKVRI